MKALRTTIIAGVLLVGMWAVGQVTNNITANVTQTLQFTLLGNGLRVTGPTNTVTLLAQPPIDTNALIAAVLAQLTNRTATGTVTGTMTVRFQ